MLAIEVELLTGRYVATAYNNRNLAEWPPHPSRLYSAFVATWHEDEGTEAEKNALGWLERQAPPQIVASEAFARTAATVFVPVNDIQTVTEPLGARAKLAAAQAALVKATDAKQIKKAEATLAKAQEKLRTDTEKATASPTKITSLAMANAHAILPDSRLRQARTFPSVTPEEPKVVFVWSEDPPDDVQSGLSSLCLRLSRLGHSSSMVRAYLRQLDALPKSPEAFVPHDNGPIQIRVPEAGQMERLDEAYLLHRGLELRILPTDIARYQRGHDITVEPPTSNFGDDWVVFERYQGDRIPMAGGVGVAEAMRACVLKAADQPIPPGLSGHNPDGPKIERAHVAFVPLPNVANKWATGDIMGLAVVFPRDLPPEERQATLRALAKWEDRAKGGPLQLWQGRLGKISVRRAMNVSKQALKPQIWSAPSQVWATATPIALDRNPGDLQSKNPAKRAKAFAEAEATVKRACGHIGLPEPKRVEVLTSVLMSGSVKPRHFPPYPLERHKHRRVLVHARLIFGEKVQGPVILGSGRYFGLGLCRPMNLEGPQ